MKLIVARALALGTIMLTGAAHLGWSQQNPPAPQTAAPPAAEPDQNSMTLAVVGRLFSEDQANLKDYWPALEKRTKDTWQGIMPAVAQPPQSVGGTVRIVCVVHTDGSVTDMTLEQRSGKAALDRAALAAIRQSAPFDAFPSGISTDKVRVRFTFLYNGGTTVAPPVDGVKKPGPRTR